MSKPRKANLEQTLVGGAQHLSEEHRETFKSSLEQLMTGFDKKITQLNNKNEKLVNAVREEVKVDLKSGMTGHVERLKEIPPEVLPRLGEKVVDLIQPILEKNQTLIHAKKELKVSFDNGGSVSLVDRKTNRPR